MDDPPSVEVRPTLEFRNGLRALSKRYRKIRSDIEPVIENIRQGNFLGDRIPGIEYEIYKIRIANRDAKKGKSGGYRLIYWVRSCENARDIILVALYSKSDQETVLINEITEIIEKFCLVAQ